MITQAQRDQLGASLNRDDVRTREGGGKKTLSYVEGWWVIAEMNRIFGNAGWSYRATVNLVDDSVADDKKHTVTYLGRCVLTVGDCVIEDVGAGHGKDRSRGIAIESASKEAATDALKRCAKSLGNRLGLALYDKEQTHVTDEPAVSQAVSDEAALMIAMLDGDPKEARTQIRAAWSRLPTTDRAAISAAIEQRKKVA